ELDVYLSYTHEFGPIDVTVGNIAFFIDRRAETQVTTTGTFVDGPGFPTVADPDGHTFTLPDPQKSILPTVENETFDRIYIAVSAPRLFHSNTFSLVPKIYYYQTVLSEGEDNFDRNRLFIVARDESASALAEEALGFPHFFALNGLSERN